MMILYSLTAHPFSYPCPSAINILWCLSRYPTERLNPSSIVGILTKRGLEYQPVGLKHIAEKVCAETFVDVWEFNLDTQLLD